MSKIAITRSQPQADETAARLKAMGAEPVVAPLLEIQFRDFDPDFADAQAILLTSVNGVRALQAIQQASAAAPTALPILTVGDATAEAARAAGFANVRSADGDGDALVALARQTLTPSGGVLVHISGADLATDVAAILAAQGFKTERRIAYAAKPAAALPVGFSANPDAVLFHSARAADVFGSLGAPNAEQMFAVCISARTAERAKSASKRGWKGLIVAPYPREDALLEAAVRSTRASA